MLLALLISSNVFILQSAELKPKPSSGQRLTIKQQKELVKKSFKLTSKIDEILSNEKLDLSAKKVEIQKIIAEIKKSLTKISDKTLKERNADSLIEYRNMQPQDIEKMIIEAKADSIVNLLIERNFGEETFLKDIEQQIESLKNKTAPNIKEIDEILERDIRNEIDDNAEDLMKPLMNPFIKEMRNRLEIALFMSDLKNFEKYKQSISKEDQDIMSKFLEDLALNITPSKDYYESSLKEYRDLAQTRAQKERATLAKAKKSLTDTKAMYEKIPAKTKDILLDKATAGLKELQIKEAEAKIKAAQEIVDARKAADKARFNKEQQAKIVEKGLADAKQRKQRAAEAERAAEERAAAERLEIPLDK